jgi:hypothetical protein
MGSLVPSFSARTAIPGVPGQPNPPKWPNTVKVFSPRSSKIGKQLHKLYETQQAIFGDGRLAVLFKPGRYTDNVPVGYYTTVHGLGSAPEDVVFEGNSGVHEASTGPNLLSFWRSVENLLNRPSRGVMVWSVSQAAPLRRLIVDGDLRLGTEANTQGSGGFVSDIRVTGTLNFTMQQQWLVRNSQVGRGTSYFQDPPRSVNFVFVGTHGAPDPTDSCTDAAVNPVSPKPQQLVIDASPVSIEKPYITIDDEDKYQLVTPRASFRSRGVQWDRACTSCGGHADSASYVDGFESVFVANNSTDVTEINDRLAEGLHVVLAPGVYRLPAPIVIGRNESKYQVLLGLGMATLVPMQGGAALHVNDAPGVRIAGILLEAGPVASDALMTVGTTPEAGEPKNPVLLSDVHARVGGPGVDPKTGLGPPVAAKAMIKIHMSNVVLDNVWLWRADVQNEHRTRDCEHGLVVNGHNVTAYGLAAEHTQSDNVVWNGEQGRVYFYQAELDGLAQTKGDGTPDYGPNGVSGYRINAVRHQAKGVGVYCWFSNSGIVVQSGVKVAHPETINDIQCPFSWVWENDNSPPKGDSTIKTAIEAAVATKTAAEAAEDRLADAKQCPRCGRAKGGRLNCCGSGGAWAGQCGDGAWAHERLRLGIPTPTWAEGFIACGTAAAEAAAAEEEEEEEASKKGCVSTASTVPDVWCENVCRGAASAVLAKSACPEICKCG